MTRITILPRAPGDPTMQSLPDCETGLPSRPETVLVIEDDDTMRLALACMVADTHRQVMLARDAEHALQRMSLVDPDIILCDFLLDGMNGREFCQRMKSTPRWRYVPIIVVTRMDAQGIITDLLQSGADDVLVKPVRPAELRARVACGLRTRARYLELGQAVLESRGRTISVVA